MVFDEKHPYFQADGIPKTKKSVVVFADILGFKEDMRKAYEEGWADKLLSRLRFALTESYSLLKGKGSDILEPKSYATKTFTDNIVIGLPIMEDAEGEMALAYFHLGLLQLNMARSGFFIRGGISIGELYIDDDIVFGDGLIAAYRIESQLARDPRMVLGKSTIKYLKTHLSYYGEIQYSPQYRDLLEDVDGQFFLNYLESILIAEGEVGPFYNELIEHKEAVEQKLDEFKSNPLIWSKYAWVANYHNYFCDQYEYFNDSHKIDPSKLMVHPTRII